MNKLQSQLSRKLLFAVLCAVFLFATPLSALELELDPSKAVSEIGGTIRVKIFANNASSLISMGVKVSFDPLVFQVTDAQKNTDFDQGWIMDADGDPQTEDDQYTLPDVTIDNQEGIVTMIGGRLTGLTTQGLAGKVLLGWIDFNAIAMGTSDLNVDLAKYHPQHPDYTFDNFVNIGGSVDEPTNKGSDLGKICVAEDNCPADFNVDGFCNMTDWRTFREDWGRIDCANPLLETCECDLNNDGQCNMTDWRTFREDWGREDCPVCE